MKKKKLFEVSLINKTYSKTLQDTTKFYTSDTALDLGFELLEVEYNFDSAEILLLNVDDRSLVTRDVTKDASGFTYELEDDIIDHFGEWKAQLKFEKDGEIYVSSPVIFRIENDLSNDRPPQLTEVNSWKNLRAIADGLIDDLRIELESLAEHELEIENAETVRQQAESQRQSAELIRVENEEERVLNYENMQETIDMIGKVKLVNLVPNSNFANGLGNWTDYQNRMTKTQKDGYIEMVVNGNTARIEYTITDKPNDKWFMVAKIKSTSTQAGIGSGAGRYLLYTKINEWEIVSGYKNPVHNNFSIIANEIGSTMQVEYAMLFNMTSIFGAGNEPSKTIMDWIINSNGYFDELHISRDDIQQYELNQLKQAVIALGGTI